MEHNYTIDFKRIRLRPLGHEDIEKQRILRNSLSQFFVNQAEISAEQQGNWFQKYLKKDDDIIFAVEQLKEPGVFVGSISLYNIDWENRIAECGRTVIDKDLAKEKGIGMEATKAIVLLALEVLHFKKLVGEILKSNERILKIDLRAGFRIVSENENMWFVEATRETLILEGN